MRRVLVVAVLFFVTLFLSAPVTIAHTADFVGWTWASGTSDLSIQRFTCANRFASDISTSWTSWNNISPQVHFRNLRVNFNDDDLGCDVRIFGREITGSTLGFCSIYSRNILGRYVHRDFSSYTGKVAKAEITLDTSTDGLYGQETARRRKTIIHELGHALALAHPTCGSVAIMHQGYIFPAYLTINPHDRANLQYKWRR